jgi:O-antigen ligase
MRWVKSESWSKFFSFGGAGIMLLAIVLTQSRGALICLAGGLLLFFGQLLVSRTISLRSAVWILIVVGFTVVATSVIWSLIPNIVVTDFMTRLMPLASDLAAGDMSDNNRAVLWAPVIASIVSHPLIGIGLGNQSQSGFLLVDMVTSAHNVLLEAWLELGILGMVALLVFLWSAWSMWRSLAFNRNACYFRFCLAGLLSFQLSILHCMGEPSFWGIQFAYLFWTALGAGMALLHLQTKKTLSAKDGR